MRGGVWAVCVATFGFAGTAWAQPHTPAKNRPATANDPFSDPIFAPPGPSFETTPAALYDASTVNDPFANLSASGGGPQVSDECACAPGFSTWFIAELLIGRTRGPTVSPIVTTGPDSAGLLAGTVGQPTTLPLFGGKRILNDWRSGLRLEAGTWLDQDHRTGVSGRFYSLFSASERFAAPTGGTIVNVPHFIPVGGAAVQIPVFVGFPGITAGTVQTNAGTTFTGGDVNFRRLLDRGDGYRVELLAGYRQLYLSDELGSSFAVSAVGLPGLVLPRITGTDAIRTRNDFTGPQLGLYASTGWERLTLEAHATMAMGATISDLTFTRSRVGFGNPTATTTLLTAVGVPAPIAGALAAATGQFPLAGTRTDSSVTYFGLVGEGGLRANWRVTDHFRLTAGYGFLYWNNVRRAQEVFASSAALRPRAADFTTHLFSVGLDLRY